MLLVRLVGGYRTVVLRALLPDTGRLNDQEERQELRNSVRKAVPSCPGSILICCGESFRYGTCSVDTRCGHSSGVPLEWSPSPLSLSARS